jgi:hypothetical protein
VKEDEKYFHKVRDHQRLAPSDFWFRDDLRGAPMQQFDRAKLILQYSNLKMAPFKWKKTF